MDIYDDIKELQSFFTGITFEIEGLKKKTEGSQKAPIGSLLNEQEENPFMNDETREKIDRFVKAILNFKEAICNLYNYYTSKFSSNAS